MLSSYVAMHTMQEGGDEGHGHGMNGYTGGTAAYGGGGPPGQSPKQLTMRDTMLSVVGMLLPLLAQIGHAH